MRLKKFGLIFILAFLPCVVFSQNKIVQRYLINATEKYNANDFPQAYRYINQALDGYGSTGLPSDVEELAENIYYSYLGVLKTNFNATTFSEIKNKLASFTTINSTRIQQLVKVIDAQQSAASSSSASSSSSSSTAYYAQSQNSGISAKDLNRLIAAINKGNTAEAEREAKRIEREEQQAVERAIKEAEEAERRAKNEEELKAIRYESAKSNKQFMLIIICIVAGFAFVLLIVLLANHSSNKKSQRQFNETLQSVARLAENFERPTYQAVPYESHYQMLGAPAGVGGSSLGLPPPMTSDTDISAIKELTRRCESIGAEIDTATGRKNNARNVAELSYKVCISMGMGQADAMLMYAASLVYDVGFLSVDKELFKAGKLTPAESNAIRNHVHEGLNRLDFVPEKFRQIFEDATLNHHENFDGSGYPSGLSATSIPFVARLIHATESFVALISKRAYRSIIDKESALQELYSRSGMYDETILQAMDKVI